MNKYIPCCDRQCLVANCDTNENGGCYCLCRLVDAYNGLDNIAQGYTILLGIGQVYIPDLAKAKAYYDSLSPFDKDINDRERHNVEKTRKKLRKKIQKYQNPDWIEPPPKPIVEKAENYNPDEIGWKFAEVPYVTNQDWIINLKVKND